MSYGAITSVTAIKTEFSNSFIHGYERGESPLRKTVTTEIMKDGGVYKFVIGDSANALPVTRGVDGRITPRPINNTQVTLTLAEWHDLPVMTGFNIFTHQAGSAAEMEMKRQSYEVINRQVENDILTVLATASNSVSATASTDAFGLLKQGLVNLHNRNVKIGDGNVFACISMAFLSKLQEHDQFSSKDFVPLYTYDDGIGSKMQVIKWNGINLFLNTGLSGLGTASETCFLYHRGAVGHAIDMENFSFNVGYNEEQDYTYVKGKSYTGSTMIQNNGVEKMLFNGSTTI